MNVNTAIFAALATSSLLLASGAIAQVAPATESNTSTVKQSEVGQRAEKKDIDQEITNAKLRASTGSKKLISISSSLNYAGASILNPTSTERPQLNSGSNAADPTNLSGNIAIKYRATDHDNLSLGFGVQYTPSFVKNRKTGEKAAASTTASSPYVDYSRVFRAGEVQNVLSASVSKYTLKEDIDDAKLNYSVGLSHSFMVGIGDSKFEIGMSSAVSQDIYSEFVDGAYQYSLGLNPILEYAFTDKASFRTVYRAVGMATQVEDNTRWKQFDASQSMGFGYAVTRDVYVYPNMQWKWNRVASDATTVGFSTNINL